MHWLSGSRFLARLFCFTALWLALVKAAAQDPFEDVLPSNTQLWKSFQDEMRTLEQAAHRVNNLLSVAHQPSAAASATRDQDAKPSDSNPDVTVLASSSKQLKNGQHTDTAEQQKTAEADKNEEKTSENGSSSVIGGSRPNPLSFGSLINSLGFFKNLPEPWWKGKNVCVQKSEKVEEKQSDKEKEVESHVFVMGTGTFEHCKQTAGKYICTTVTSTPESTKTVSTTYQCCEGFRREPEGCVAGEDKPEPEDARDTQPSTDHLPDKDALVLPQSQPQFKSINIGKSVEDSYSSHSEERNVELKDPVDVVESLGSKEFAALMKSQDVMGSMGDKNITIFAPLDSAMKSHHTDFQESNQIRASRVARAVDEWNDVNSMAQSGQTRLGGRDIVLTHITDSLLDVDDFTNEMVVKSKVNESPLRVNIYPGREEPVITVNCARLRSWDGLAKHARVHTIDRVLEPITQSVVDVLSQPQFSQFRQYLEQEGLMELLANASAVTVFAPNNEAWDKLGSGLRDKYSRGEACIDKVLRHHLLPLTLCAAPATEGRLSTADVDGELVRLVRDDNQQLMVDDKGRVVQEDIVATNGVVHVLDKVLTPKSAKPLSELLISSNHTGWLELLDKAGLLEELNKQENITVFVPTQQALAEESTRTLLDGMDGDALRRTLLYHVTQRAPTCDLRDRATLTTQTGDQLRVSLFNPLMVFGGLEPRAAVQCAPLGLTDGKACHVTAHEVTRLLMPPTGSVLQLLVDDTQLSTLRSVLEGTQIEKELEGNSELLGDGFTLLAPSDEAFNKLDEEVLSKMLTDKKFADEVIRMHILKEPVCCASITSVPWPFTNSIRTIDNKKIEMNRDRKDRVLFGNSATEKCDVIATDGIVHVIDTVILPEAGKVKLGNIAFGTPDRRIMLFGI